MGVYVDQLFKTPKSTQWPYQQACHLVADTLEELHDFAVNKLGMRRSWFQDGRLAHYDLTANMRKKALARGAEELTLQEMGEFIKKHERPSKAKKRSKPTPCKVTAVPPAIAPPVGQMDEICGCT